MPSVELRQITPTQSVVAPEPAPAPVGQPATSEGAAVPAPDEQISPQFAQLARKEKMVRQRHRENAAKEADLAAREAKLQSVSDYKTRLTQNPLEVLNEAGITYEQLTQAILSAPNAESQELMKLKKEIDSLKTSQTSQQKLYEDQQKAQYDQAVNQIRYDVTEMVKSDPAFDMIKETKAEDAVVELIQEVFKSSGGKKLLTIDEAATEVESHLLEEALKLQGLRKVKEKLAPPPAQVQAPQKPSFQSKKSIPYSIKTLTHAGTPPSTSGKLSNVERAKRVAMGLPLE